MQLWIDLDPKQIPLLPDDSGVRPIARAITIKKPTLLFWPNGRQCFEINHWLSEIAQSGTTSASTYASRCSFLIRFCFRNKILLSKLSDKDLYDFTNNLSDEPIKNNYFRSNKQIKSIIQTWINFLIWYQKNHIRDQEQPLIGEKDSYARITIVKKRDSKNREYFEHPCMLKEDAPRTDKHPISHRFIEKIRDQISEQFDLPASSPRAVAHGGDPELVFAVNHYIYERRLFVLWAMEMTGLRPEELVTISLLDNITPEKAGGIFIPTVKRRKTISRFFTLPISDLSYFSRYIMARNEFLITLKTKGFTPVNYNALLLGTKGERIRKESIARDFKRIAHKAGINDDKICLSMFRHRFITREITISIIEHLGNAADLEVLERPSVRESILLKVIKKTGHASTSSLFHYYDETAAVLLVNNILDSNKLASTRQIADTAMDNSRKLADLQHMLRRGDTEQFAKLYVELENKIKSVNEVISGLL